nr:unnamed protein product [Callosobruchus chinensis]
MNLTQTTVHLKVVSQEIYFFIIHKRFATIH